MTSEDFEDCCSSALLLASEGFDSTRGSWEGRLAWAVKRAVWLLPWRQRETALTDKEPAAPTREPAAGLQLDELSRAVALSVLSPSERTSLLYDWDVIDMPPSRWNEWRARKNFLDMNDAIRLAASGSQRQREWAAFYMADHARVEGSEWRDQIEQSSIAAIGDCAARGLPFPAVIQLGHVWALKHLDANYWRDEWVEMLEPEVLSDALFYSRGRYFGRASVRGDYMRATTERALWSASRRPPDSAAVWMLFDLVRIATDTFGDEAFRLIRETLPPESKLYAPAVGLALSRLGESKQALQELKVGNRSGWTSVETIASRLKGRPSFANRAVADTVRHLPRDKQQHLLPVIADSPHIFVRHSATRISRQFKAEVGWLVHQISNTTRATSYLSRSLLSALRDLDYEALLILGFKEVPSQRWQSDSWLMHDAVGIMHEARKMPDLGEFHDEIAQVMQRLLLTMPRGLCPFAIMQLFRD